MPEEGVELYPKERLLTFEDIEFVVRTAVPLGIRRLRITGGEPLLRKNLPELVRKLKQIEGLKEVSMTTNATLLPKFAVPLREAGLDRLNISLDALSDSAFEQMTRYSMLDKAWNGIEEAERVGFKPLKINAVILDGFNDGEFDRWVQLTMTKDIIVRFLELMPIGEGVELARNDRFHDLTEARKRLQKRYNLQPQEVDGEGPARYWKVPGAAGSIGFITPISNPYCDTCSRFRLTSTGEIRPCLAYDTHVDIHDAIRERDPASVMDGLRKAASIKATGHEWSSGQVTAMSMSTLGG
jgi:cyclic pyranopterin phosphate synthase